VRHRAFLTGMDREQPEHEEHEGFMKIHEAGNGNGN